MIVSTSAQPDADDVPLLQADEQRNDHHEEHEQDLNEAVLGTVPASQVCVSSACVFALQQWLADSQARP